jgi:predicted lipid-binding transport protein (Tim44 family)
VNRLLGIVFALILGSSMAIPDAEAARRIGGGKSLGMQRQTTPPAQRPQAPQAAPQPGAPAGAPAAAPGGRWLGPVAGLLAGGVIGALLFGGAFEGIKLMDVVLILALAAGIMLLLRAMRKPQAQYRRSEPMQYAGAGQGPVLDPQPPAAIPSAGSAAVQPAARLYPAGFDADAFARQARTNFVRLQQANDRGDLEALRGMMTPELYREIEAQVRERGGATQHTEVVTLDAEVLEVATERDLYIASVRFSGLMKDDPAAPAEKFSEVWHLQKPLDGSSGWLMAGIQQD